MKKGWIAFNLRTSRAILWGLVFFLFSTVTSAQSLTFSGRQLATGAQYHAAADLDGDGRVDLAAAGVDLEILIGNGNATFQVPRKFPIGTSTSGVVVADFNNDSRPDVAVSLNGPREVAVFLGAGDGNFGPALRYPTNAGQAAPTSIVAADFNQDGRVDLMTSDPFGCSSSCAAFPLITYFGGNGDGTFQPARQMNVGTPPHMLKVGDLNRDGITDVVGAAAFGKVLVLLGNGDGTFRQMPDILIRQNIDNTDVVIHDFNRDGVLDIVAAADADSMYGVCLGNGDGTFRAPTIIVDSLAQRGAWLSLGDYNRDGRQDVGIGFSFCCPALGAGAFGVMLSRGDGTFDSIRRFIVPNTGRIQLATLFPITSDLNADGRPDVVGGFYNNMGGTTGGTIVLTNTSGLAQRSPALGSLTISPATTLGSTTVEGEISLAAGTVATSNLTFSMSTSDPSVAAFAFDSISPPFFMVQGMTNLRFKINTSIVSTAQTVTIRARNNNLGSRSATLTVTPPATPLALGSIEVAPGIFAGNDGSGQVSLTQGHVAPAGGVTVFLTNDNPSLITSMPSSVTIPAGQSTAGFPFQTWTTGTTTPVTFTATYDGVTKTDVVNIHAPSQLVPISSVTLSPTSIVGGTNQAVQGTITLAGNAPNEGATIMLSTDHPDVVILPRSVRIFFSTQNSTTVNFVTNPVSAPTNATITAHFGDSTQSAVLTVLPAPAGPTLSSLSLDPTSVTGGNSSLGTVTISAAQSSPTVIGLSSSSSPVVSVPTSVTIPAGATSAGFTVNTSSVSSSFTATITATLNGGSRSATLTVNPAAAPTTDTVAIQRVEYELQNRVLRVEATSTRADATMRVFVTSSGELIGTLTNDGGGRYRGQLSWSVNPQNVTVRSSFGGQASRDVVVK